MKELKSERTENSKTYLLSDGTKKLEIANGDYEIAFAPKSEGQIFEKESKENETVMENDIEDKHNGSSIKICKIKDGGYIYE